MFSNRSTTTKANAYGEKWFNQTCPTRDVINRTKSRNKAGTGNVTAVNVSKSGDALVAGLGRGGLVFAENYFWSNSHSITQSIFFRSPITRILFLFEDSFVVAVSTETGNVFRLKIDSVVVTA